MVLYLNIVLGFSTLISEMYFCLAFFIARLEETNRHFGDDEAKVYTHFNLATLLISQENILV